MSIYLHGDSHLLHANIIKYCNRPFKTVEEMDYKLIKRWNDVVGKDDLVYHVGDFAYKNKTKTYQIEKLLHGKIVHIEGNHDGNNGIKIPIVYAKMRFGGLNIWVEHIPPIVGDFPLETDLILSGHVHNLWKHKFVDDIPVINVGTDVWNYQPVSINAILKYYKEIESKVNQ